MRQLLGIILLMLAGRVAVCQSTSASNQEEPGLAWLYPVKPTVSGTKATYICGSRSINKQGKVVGQGNLNQQANQAINNIKAALKTVDLTLGDVVQVNYIVKGDGKTPDLDLTTLAQLKRLDSDLFGTPPSIIERRNVAKLTDDDLLIEIEVIAAK